MNWTTSGRHRALYSQRRRRRQMHFPSQVQRQRVRPPSPVRSSQPARTRNSTTPWYILPVGDDEESQDIRVLELERKGAVRAAEAEGATDTGTRVEEPALESAPRGVSETSGARPSPTPKRSHAQQEGAVQDEGRSEMRCIFTPIKKARKYDQLPSAAVQRAKPSATGERPPSSITSGVDMLFFNDGQELPQKKRARNAQQNSAGSASSELQQQHSKDQEMHRREAEAQEHSSDGDSFSFYEPRAPHDEASKREFKLSRIDSSNSYAGSDPDMVFASRASELFTSGRDSTNEKLHDTPRLSPFAASPLSFRMSRAEVLQTQLHSKTTRADQFEMKKNFTASPGASPSPSTSTSSQGSIVLGRPPPGWQKRMFLSLKEERSTKTELHIGSQVSSPENLELASSPGEIPSRLANDRRPDTSSLPIISPRSSTGSDPSRLISNALIPIDAKERIMAAANSQQVPGDSLTRFQRPPTAGNHGTNSSDTTTCRNAMQRSWTMSSRTKRILDAVSVSKTSAKESLTGNSSTKYQEMESVAIYMYTLVQCYRIDESIRADSTTLPVVNAQLLPEPTSPPTVTTVSKQTACRREITFSSKHAN